MAKEKQAAYHCFCPLDCQVSSYCPSFGVSGQLALLHLSSVLVEMDHNHIPGVLSRTPCTTQGWSRSTPPNTPVSNTIYFAAPSILVELASKKS